MALVHIGRQHRADFDADLRAVGLSSFTILIDTQPNLLDGVDGHNPFDSGQCSRCTLLDFLAMVPNLKHYPALAELRAFFVGLPELVVAVAQRDVARVRQTQSKLGASGVFEIVPYNDDGTLAGVPKIELLRADAPPPSGARSRVRNAGERTVLVEPGSLGPAWLGEQVRALSREGVRRVLVGYHQHAAAMESFSAFVERDDFAGQWSSLVLGARNLGFDHLGLAMAYPPCATLKVGPNAVLETLRARLDLSFRRLGDDASLMCPENVSGYSLTHDVRSALGRSPAERTSCAIRHANLVFTF